MHGIMCGSIVFLHSSHSADRNVIGKNDVMGKIPKINKKCDCNKQKTMGKNPKINKRIDDVY